MYLGLYLALIYPIEITLCEFFDSDLIFALKWYVNFVFNWTKDNWFFLLLNNYILASKNVRPRPQIYISTIKYKEIKLVATLEF